LDDNQLKKKRLGLGLTKKTNRIRNKSSSSSKKNNKSGNNQNNNNKSCDRQLEEACLSIIDEMSVLPAMEHFTSQASASSVAELFNNFRDADLYFEQLTSNNDPSTTTTIAYGT